MEYVQAARAKFNNVWYGDRHYGTSGIGKTVLITGGSGFVAAHVLNAFLARGYNVRTTVRNEESAEKVRQSHAPYLNQLEFFIVKDVAEPGGHNKAVQGVDGVIHTASPFVTTVEDNERDLLDPAIKGTTELLTSILRYNPNVKRVVLTSSFAAIIDLGKGARPGYTYTEEDWNPVTYEQAAKKDADGGIAYCASKTLAEKAAFDFVKKNKTLFQVMSICPPMIYGPAAHTADLEHLNTSSADIYRLIDGSQIGVPETSFFAFVDVRDVGEAHARAYELRDSVSGGRRFFCTAGRYTYQQICNIIHTDFPELRNRVPIGTPDSPFPDVYNVSAAKIRWEVGMGFRPLETTIHDMVNQFLALEKKAGKVYEDTLCV